MIALASRDGRVRLSTESAAAKIPVQAPVVKRISLRSSEPTFQVRILAGAFAAGLPVTSHDGFRLDLNGLVGHAMATQNATQIRYRTTDAATQFPAARRKRR